MHFKTSCMLSVLSLAPDVVGARWWHATRCVVIDECECWRAACCHMVWLSLSSELELVCLFVDACTFKHIGGWLVS